jgi:Response regulator containing CheY-like receiver, AAA-type ATPase, and DNA-binding domains
VNCKLLFVDDEPSVLDGYRRTLRKDFEVFTADSGMAGLELIKSDGPFGVVISDMRMPEMDGVRFLSESCSLAPDSVRVLLTGYADFQSAINAVNQGRIFRFLTKPCTTDVLRAAIDDCIAQYMLITAEKEILEKTLMGSIEALTDVLSLASPMAFSRATRIRRYVQQLAAAMNLERTWKVEMAALVSQLGCITISDDIVERAHRSEPLSADEKAQFSKLPTVASDLIGRIPRLNDVAAMVALQQNVLEQLSSDVSEEVRIGASMLQLSMAFDDLISLGISEVAAHEKLRYRVRQFPRVSQYLTSLHSVPTDVAPHAVRVTDLTVGMILAQEVRSKDGMLIATSGLSITPSLKICFNNLAGQRAIPDRLQVMQPAPKPVSA